MSRVAVIGGGPAGLAAAEVIAGAGHAVDLYEAKPSVGRKFLMAGKSGLNLTHAEPLDAILPRFAEAEAALTPALRAFDNQAIRQWAEGLGQKIFTGTTGRVFPVAMKASPLLRAWLGRLREMNVRVNVHHRWTGWLDGKPMVNGAPVLADATVLACGGASWSRLGSDGAWADWIGIDCAGFAPANAAIAVQWSQHMDRHLGAPLKGVAWRAGSWRSRGEAILSVRGVEGGGVYSVSRGVRIGEPLHVDLLPDLSVDEVAARLARPRGKTSLSNHMRKTLRLDPVKIALAQEWGRPLPTDPLKCARRLKKLTVGHAGLRPLDEAISTAGGVPFAALDDRFMLSARPGVFCAGEMLDWEAPTGGYLLTACLATGRWAGQGAVDYLAAAAL